eukprot:928389_1
MVGESYHLPAYSLLLPAVLKKENKTKAMSFKALQSVIAACCTLSVVMASNNASGIASPATRILAMQRRHNTPSATQLFGALFEEIHSFMNYNDHDEIGLRKFFENTNYFDEIETEHTRKPMCRWQGITCTAKNKTGRLQYKVTEIRLHGYPRGHNLAGTIRYDAFLKQCNVLDQMDTFFIQNHGNNFFIDGLPPNLRTLDLGYNGLRGNLSNYVNQTALSKLQHLTHITLSRNALSNVQWSKLPKSTEHLDLSQNRFSYVPIENVLASLSGKKLLILRRNNLHGFKINWTENMLCNLGTLCLRRNNRLAKEDANVDGLVQTLLNASWISSRQNSERYRVGSVIFLPVARPLAEIYNQSLGEFEHFSVKYVPHNDALIVSFRGEFRLLQR